MEDMNSGKDSFHLKLDKSIMELNDYELRVLLKEAIDRINVLSDNLWEALSNQKKIADSVSLIFQKMEKYDESLSELGKLTINQNSLILKNTECITDLLNQ